MAAFSLFTEFYKTYINLSFSFDSSERRYSLDPSEVTILQIKITAY